MNQNQNLQNWSEKYGNWIHKTKLEPDGCEQLKSHAVTKGCLQIPGVDFAESFSPVAMDSSTWIIIGIILYYSDKYR